MVSISIGKRFTNLPPPFSVGEFRLELPRILERFRDDPHSGPLTVGRHRRVEAIVLSPAEYERLASIARDSIDGAEARVE